MDLAQHLNSLAGGDFVSGLVVLFALLIAHALCDHPLQGEFVALRKNRHFRPDGDGAPTIWPYCLTVHSLIHAGGVWIVTGSVALGFAEFVAHWVIDFLKAEGKTSIHIDQLLHLLCKIAYLLVIAFVW